MRRRKYLIELRERATRLALEALAESARSKDAIERISDELGVHPQALRMWVRQGRGGSGHPMRHHE